MPPTPTFHTGQITLRPYIKEDAPELLAILNHPDLTGRRYIPWDFSQDLPLTLAQAEKTIESSKNGTKKIKGSAMLSSKMTASRSSDTVKSTRTGTRTCLAAPL